MTEKKTTIVGGDAVRTTISDEIAGAVREANLRIDQLDTDPIIRLALARVAVRTFAEEMVANYPEHAAHIALEFESMADLLRDNEDAPEALIKALGPDDAAEIDTATGGETDAEDRQSASEPRGRGQADPEGRDTGRAARKGSRNNGAERVRKEHAILRVGGS